MGFFLDPLYKVHWNNQTQPISYEITNSSGVKISPAKGIGPKVDEPADADPREFLIDVDATGEKDFKITVKYFACDDAETFCKPITQSYNVTLQRDRDGGSRRGPGQRRGFAGRRPGFPPRGLERGRPDFPPNFEPLPADPSRKKRLSALRLAVKAIKKLDEDNDGKISKQEMTRARGKITEEADVDKDGLIDLKELTAWFKSK